MKLKEAKTHIKTVLKAGLVPMLHGSPGTGKSAVIHQIAKEWKLKMIDIRLSQIEPVDLSGFPKIMGDKASYLPMDMFPVEGDPIPEGYQGWFIFLDEINGGARSVIKACYKLILDRMVGNHRLHKNVVIAAAGNLETDGAIVTPMGTAMQSRLIHLPIEPDFDSWCEWAEPHGIDHKIVSYIRFRPSQLYNFDPKHSDHTYPSYRTWDFANRLLKASGSSPRDIEPLLEGTLGKGTAREFVAFCDIYQRLPDINQMIADPHKVHISDEPSIKFAVSGMISEYANPDNMESLMVIVNKLPLEFQVITLKGITKRHIQMINHPLVNQWLKDNEYLLEN